MTNRSIEVKEMIIGAILSGVISYVFYKSVIVSVISGLFGMSFTYFNKKAREKAVKQKKMESFKELLNSMYSILLSGKSFRNSLELSIDELRDMNESDLLLEDLNQLKLDIHLGTSEIVAWVDFSEKVDIESCYEFVDVLEETYAVGGQITKVINRTCQILSDKIDLYLDLELIISSKKFEFRIMMISPIILLAILSKSNESYMEILYTTIYGRLVMTGVLVAMIFSYIIGKFIIHIEV